ncbi:hypothetical protein [Methylobacterium mesophilicum]
MRLPRLLIAFAFTMPLAGCGDPVGRVALDVSARPVLPVPPDVKVCFAKAFPEIPADGFSRITAVRIIAEAKLLDRAKSACGNRALAWIDDVTAQFGRPTP